MPYLSKSELNRIVGDSYKSSRHASTLKKSVTDEIENKNKTYDVFLSHSYLDKETIYQVNYFLEEKLGLDVFVYWIESPNTDRTEVTPATAAQLRDVMNRCASLIYAVSSNASTSKWMPWELGYSDAKHGRIAILPITNQAMTASAYSDQEFVGLYPYIDIENDPEGNRKLWVNSRNNPKYYSQIGGWVQTGKFGYHP